MRRKDSAPAAGNPATGLKEPTNGARHPESDPEADRDLLGPIVQSVHALRRLAQIEWERVRLSVRTHRRRALLRLWEAAFLGTLTVAGVFLLVRGLTRAFAALLGASWAGDLAGAAVILGGAVAFALLSTARRDRADLEAMRERLDPRASDSVEQRP